MRPVPLPAVLQQHDFAGLARAMEGMALNEAMAVQVLHEHRAALPQPLSADTLALCARRAEQAAAVHSILLALVPHEAQVRQMIGGAA